MNQRVRFLQIAVYAGCWQRNFRSLSDFKASISHRMRRLVPSIINKEHIRQRLKRGKQHVIIVALQQLYVNFGVLMQFFNKNGAS